MSGRFVAIPFLVVGARLRLAVRGWRTRRPASPSRRTDLELSRPPAAPQDITITSTLPDAPWTASSNAGWLTVSTGLGAGSGIVTLTAAAQHDISHAARRHRHHRRSQRDRHAGRRPRRTPRLIPTSWTLAAAVGGTLDVGLTTADPGAPWTASSTRRLGDPWCRRRQWQRHDYAHRPDPHTTSARPRSANVTIAGITFGVTQAGATPEFTIAPDANGTRRRPAARSRSA
jgi:hypothetical protein